MTLAELRQEVKSRLNGSRFLSDVRVNKFINDAQQELDRMHCWPYREKSATGTAPLTITDLDQIETVVNTSQNDYALSALDFKNLTDTFGDLSTSGTPTYYYVAWPSGSPVVATYPTSSDTIGVQYWKVTVDLSSDSDEPTAPDSFHGLLVDMAVRRAYKAQGMHKDAQAISEDIDRQLQTMLFALRPGFPESGSYQSAVGQEY